MAREIGSIAFTPLVREAQLRKGSRKTYSNWDEPRAFAGFTAAEREFITERDGFYQSSVTETGWPYVQFRGGPPGFLRVLDERTLAYADLSGNRQYLSVGNLQGNDRVMLFLMDYANRRRLKLWGRARLLEADQDPELMARLLGDSGDHAERSVIITIEASDWNCPQHITPRYTLEEIHEIIAPLQERIAQLEAQLKTRGETRNEV